MAGMPYPPKCVLWENTHPNLLCVPWIPWEDYNVGARVLGWCSGDRCTP